VEKEFVSPSTQTTTSEETCAGALMLSNLTARTSGELHPKTEIAINDIAVADDSVIQNRSQYTAT
jgi:hypothetical protein